MKKSKNTYGIPIIGYSEAILTAISDAVKVANTNTTTLITGESGTGKELIAKLIHRASARADMPLVILNCAAFPESLIEDELFGHERGAFTDAKKQKIGKFELADSGTLFLDEIGDMGINLQAKLLRVLEDGVFCRVGGTVPIHTNVRVITATNKNIADEVDKGRFQDDLYYRLNTVQIHIPPLRERIEDIEELAMYFAKIFELKEDIPSRMLSVEEITKMLQYSWPGNVRELKNVIKRSMIMDRNVEIPKDNTVEEKLPGLQLGLTLRQALNAFKKEFIKLNLKNVNGNRSKASKVMDIQRTYLSRLISKHQLGGV